MIQVPDKVKELFKKDSIAKNFRVSFPDGEYRDLVNADMVAESVVFTESVNSSGDLKFGICEGATLEFQTFFNKNITNLKLVAGIEIDISSLDANFISQYGKTSEDVPYPFYYIPYGTFYVDSCKRDGTNNTRKIICYQNKYNNDNLLGQIIYSPNNFEYIKIKHTSDTNVPFKFNYLMMSESLGSGKKLLDDLDVSYTESEVEGFYWDRQFGNSDFTKMSNTKHDNVKISDIVGSARLCDRQVTNTIVSQNNPEVHLMVYAKKIIFSNQDIFGTVNDMKNNLSNSIYYGNHLSFRGIDTINGNGEGFVYMDGDTPVYKYVSTDRPTKGYALHVKPEAEDIFEFSFTPYDPSACAEDVLNKLEELYPRETSPYTYDYKAFTTTTESLADALCPKLIPLGSCVSSEFMKQGKIVVPEAFVSSAYPYENNLAGYTSGFSKRPCTSASIKYDPKIGNICLYPFNNGITNCAGTSQQNLVATYNGYTESYEGYTVNYPAYTVNGCIGYLLVIPTQVAIIAKPAQAPTIPTASYFINLVKDEDLIGKKYSSPQISVFCNSFERAGVSSTKNYVNNSLQPATYQKAIYIPTELCKGSATMLETLDSQNALESIIEISGMYAKLDRVTNKLTIINLLGGMGLYPSEDLFPADPRYYLEENLYPSGPSCLVSRTLWKQVWYDDCIFQPYNKVIASWKDSNNEEQYISYTIIPDDEIVNIENYKEYDLSNNIFVKNGMVTYETVQSLVERIGSRLKMLKYYRSEVEMRGLPYLEAGDGIAVVTHDDGFRTFIMRQRISGIQGLMDTIECR